MRSSATGPEQDNSPLSHQLMISLLLRFPVILAISSWVISNRSLSDLMTSGGMGSPNFLLGVEADGLVRPQPRHLILQMPSSEIMTFDGTK
jgi:hypothetical protein